MIKVDAKLIELIVNPPREYFEVCDHFDHKPQKAGSGYKEMSVLRRFLHIRKIVGIARVSIYKYNKIPTEKTFPSYVISIWPLYLSTEFRIFFKP